MSEGLIDLIFWIVLMGTIVILFRWLQKRNRDKNKND